MPVRFISTPAGRFAVLPEAEYRRLVEAVEELEDIAAYDEARRRAAGGEEYFPAELVNRLLDGENRISVWREYRGLALEELARRAGVAPAALEGLETGVRTAATDELSRLAVALGLDLDDLT